MLGLAAFLGIAGCATNAARTEGTSATPTISVALTQAPPSSLIVGTSATVSAIVSNDIANAGVDWVASCGGGINCGSFSPAHTASGAATTFTAPFSVPGHNTITVTALSTTDHSKASAASLTVISTVTGVTITQPPPASAPSGAGVSFAATVFGDPANLGVDWKVTCGTVDCTPPGGLHSASGVPATFVVPGPIQIPTIVGTTVTVTAFATADHSFNASSSLTVSAPISINITQAPPSTMLTNATATVIAVVANDTSNSGVTWSVSCHNSPCGSVSPTQTASGQAAVFTAPPTVPAPNPTPDPVVVITASSTSAGFNVSATATVTIVAPITVQITQEVPINSIVENHTAPLVATVSNDPANAGLDWSVTCGSAGACGTFSPTHTASGVATTFTAPAAVPAANTVTITAASTTNPSQTATAIVTVTQGVVPNSLLSGNFVLLLSAKNSSNGPYALGGVISGNGDGTFSGGSLDVADASGNASSSVPIISDTTLSTHSTYSIGPDGRGQIHLLINNSNGLGGSAFGANGALTLSIVLVTPQHALLSEIDSFGDGTGTLDLQNAMDLASFLKGGWNGGTYSLKLSGAEVASPFRGYFVASAVRIDFSGSYSYITDQSDAGVITSAQFATIQQNIAVTRDPDGKLTFSSAVNLGLPTHFSLDAWLIDATHFAVTDWRDSAFGTPPVIVAGYLTAQPLSPSISGTYAFTEAGATTAAQPQVAGGILTCGSTGTLDVVPLGGVGTPLTAQAINAACGAPANGRGVIMISGAGSTGISQFAAYPTSDQGLYLIELDGGTGTSGPSGAGVALQRAVVPPIAAAAFNGKYASNLLASTALGSQNFAAQIISDGVSVLSGAADLDSFNTTGTPPAGTPSSGAALSGSFTADATGNGRFALGLTFTPATAQPTPQVTTIKPACYIVDANTCLLLGLDTTAPGTGILLLQKTGL